MATFNTHPRIGIRPTIDGRRGPMKLRESLEDQTMAMAKAAAKLFTENLRYSDGEPVEVVIADTTIGRAAMTRLRIYAGAEHNHAAQKPEAWEL